MNLMDILLESNGIQENSQSISTDQSGLYCSLPIGQQISIKFNNSINSKYSQNDFVAFLVETKNNKEASSFIISLTKQRKLGYVFPITALSSYEHLPEDEWADVYGSFALQFLVNDSDFHQHTNVPDLGEKFDLNISDFYSENFAVVILGKTSLEQNNINKNQVKLILMEHGYFSCEELNSNNLYSELEENTTGGEKIVIGELSSDIDEGLSIKMDWLLSTSLREENPFSCFLTLYQVIESLSIKVFNACIEVIKENDVIDNPWLLKEKLNNVTNEKKRLKLLFSSFLKSGINAVIMDLFHQKCGEFLLEHNLVRESPTKVIDAFYKVRNTIVHRQVELNPSSYENIKNINLILYNICFELIRNLNIEKGKDEFKKNLAKEEVQEEEEA